MSEVTPRDVLDFWFGAGKEKWFAKSDEFDAEIVLVDAGVRWKPASNMGVGVHYSYFSVDGQFEDDEIIADIDLEYKGPRISFDLFF